MTEQKLSLFERIGGADAVDRLVDAFYDQMDTQPSARHIRAMHPIDLSLTKWVLKHYLVEWMGGPRLFPPRSSRPPLRERHDKFRITEREKDAWLLCMGQALADVVPDEECRRDITKGLTGMANWMINAKDQ